MMSTKRIVSFLFFAVGIAVSTASGAPIDNLSRYFAGNYTGVTPGNHLMLQINPVTFDMSHPYDYFIQVSGQFEKTNVREQGVLRIETQGNSIYLSYVPHFNPAISSMSPSAGRFSSDEMNSSCGIYLAVEGDGFSGDTRPSDCARAIRGTAGRTWRIEIEPNRITLKDARTGETLRFEKEVKK
jgi:hypothetical protein